MSIPETDVLQENPILLDRLFKAARAYYLMQEGEPPVTKLHVDLIREELVAALVSVKMIGERGPVLTPIMMSGEASIAVADLMKRADHRKEWAAAKIIFDADFNTGTLLKPGEKIE